MRAFAAVSKNRIPLFVQEDYPVLVDFLSAYYDWMQQGLITDADFLNISDIDKTKEEFLRYFKDNHAKGLPNTIEADVREVVKHIRELYKAKGTENAIKFLFKAVFNEDVDLFYPKTQILHSSDATWVRKRSVVVSPNGFPVSFFNESEAQIPFGRFYIVGAIEQIDGNYLLDISDIKGNLNAISTFDLKGETFSFVKQVSKISVDVAGDGFVVGELLDLDYGVVAQVREVTRGPVTGINIVSGGTGYNGLESVQFFDNGPLGSAGGTGVTATISQTGGVIDAVILVSGGSYYAAPPAVFCESSSGDDAVLTATGNFSGIKYLDIINGGAGLPVSEWTQVVSGATLTVEFDNLVEHPGYFANQNGMLSSKTAYLEDEHYYQYYSYVIKTGVNTEQYEKILRLFAHPAGMRFFGSLILEELVESGELSLTGSQIIIDINSVNSGAGALEFSMVEVDLVSVSSYSVPLYWTDIYKFQWFNESTSISRFGDFTIASREANKTNNLFYYSPTDMQPDCNVILVTV